jgi:protein CSF1
MLRVELQRLFFPPTYQTVEPTSTLKPGDTRIYTALKVFVELRDITTFHIPFREPSKVTLNQTTCRLFGLLAHQDWQFNETKLAGSTRKRREGGWLEVRAGGDSTINYVLPWVATQDGYDALLELHLDQVNALSSVNDMQLVRAESSRVRPVLRTRRQLTVSFLRDRCYANFPHPDAGMTRDDGHLISLFECPLFMSFAII